MKPPFKLTVLFVLAFAARFLFAADGKIATIYGAIDGNKTREQEFKAEFDLAVKSLDLMSEAFEASDMDSLTEKLSDYEMVIVGLTVDSSKLAFSDGASAKWREWLENGGTLFVTSVNVNYIIEPWAELLGEEFKVEVDVGRHCTAYAKPSMENQKMTIDRDPLLEFPYQLGKAIDLRGKQYQHYRKAPEGWKMPVTCVDGHGLFAYRPCGAGLVMYTTSWDFRKFSSSIGAKFIGNSLFYTRLRRAGFIPKTVADDMSLRLAHASDKLRKLVVKTSTDGKADKPRKLLLEPGESIDPFPAVKQASPGKKKRTLAIAEGETTVFDYAWTETVEPPLDVRLHRRDIFLGDKLIANIEINLPHAQKGKVAGIDWKMDNGSWRKGKVPSDGQRIFELTTLKPGEHELHYRLRVTGVRPTSWYTGSARFVLHTEKPYVRIRDDGSLLVDGKPFFPFGFYDVILWNQAEPVRSELVRNMGDWGYNLVHCAVKTGEEKADNTVYDTFLELCREKNVKILAPFIPESDEFIKAAVARFGKHPAVLGWSLSDEPAAQNIPPEEINRMAELVRETSYDRLIYTVFCLPGALFRYASFMDVLSTDPYPGDTNLTGVYENITLSRAAITSHGAAQWVCLQAHGGQGHSGTTPVTPRLFRSQAYVAVMAGAKGILYYTYRDFRFMLTEASQELQDAVAAFPKEFNPFMTYFLDGERKVVSEGGKDVFAVTWTLGGKTLYIAVNAGRERETDTVVPLKGGEILHKDDTVKVERTPNGETKLILGPLDRVVIFK